MEMEPSGSQPAKSFDQLMDEYEKAREDPKRKLMVLKEARKAMKTPEQKTKLNKIWDEFIEQYGP